MSSCIPSLQRIKLQSVIAPLIAGSGAATMRGKKIEMYTHTHTHMHKDYMKFSLLSQKN